MLRFDELHLKRSDTAVLVLPAGKSGHLELGFSIGIGNRAFVLFDKEPDRWDVMYGFAIQSGGDVCFSIDELVEKL